MISSDAYQIGPGEIEDCLMRHPAVLQTAAVGVSEPEEIRGNIVKVFIVLRDEFKANDELSVEIQQSLKTRLTAYKYPRQVLFLEQLPMTTTG